MLGFNNFEFRVVLLLDRFSYQDEKAKAAPFILTYIITMPNSNNAVQDLNSGLFSATITL